MRSATRKHITTLLTPLAMLAALLVVGGCETDDPTGVTDGAPDSKVAASLSASSQTGAVVEQNLTLVDQFQEPLGGLAADAGLYQDLEFDGWTGGGVSYPQQAAQTAENFRAVQTLSSNSAELTRVKSRALPRMKISPAKSSFDYEPGDTIGVEYFDSPDSAGVNALIMVTPPDIVRFVSQRTYPAQIGQVVRRDQEIVLDTGGTLEDGDDDVYHSVFHEEEHFSGEVATGTIAPESGSGPMLPGVRVQAVHHVEHPRFHPLQAWTEVVFSLDLGGFDSDGDEIFYSMEATVHWFNDAEHYAIMEGLTGGPIEADGTVRARGTFTAAPVNAWLEAINDSLTVQIGDLDNDNDDLLVEVSRLSTFDGVASDGGNPRDYVHFVPSEPVAPNEEPCGGVAEQDIYYPATWWVVHIVRQVDVECDGSGSMYLLMELQDGSSYERTITWNGDGTATISEQRLDGTVVAGSFDENTGAYDITTTYPDGHDPVSRHQHGTAQEGYVEAYDIFAWQDAHADTTYFTSTGDEETFSAAGYRVNGSLREDFTLERNEAGLLIGTGSRNDGANGDFTLEELDGGGQHLTFAAEEPNEPGNPSLEGEIWFAPDGSGTGTITYTQYGISVTYDITFGPDGTGYLTDSNGNIEPIG
ncbi:MAG: hypothetical protein ABIF77_17920 [bacterium]